MGETWSSGSCSIHGPGHVDAECSGPVLIESEVPLHDEHYQTIETLSNKLDSLFYSGDMVQQEEELGNLADAAMTILGADPNLDQTLSDKKYFKMWEVSTKVLYQGMQSTDSPEMFEKISDALALVFKVADRQTNIGPAESILRG